MLHRPSCFQVRRVQCSAVLSKGPSVPGLQRRHPCRGSALFPAPPKPLPQCPLLFAHQHPKGRQAGRQAEATQRPCLLPRWPFLHLALLPAAHPLYIGHISLLRLVSGFVKSEGVPHRLNHHSLTSIFKATLLCLVASPHFWINRCVF